MVPLILAGVIAIVLFLFLKKSSTKIETTPIAELDTVTPEEAIERDLGSEPDSDENPAMYAIVLLDNDPALSLANIAGAMMKQWPELGVIDPVLGTTGLRRSLELENAVISFELCDRLRHPETLEKRVPHNHLWADASRLADNYVGTIVVQAELKDGIDCSGGFEISQVLTQAVFGLTKSCPAAAGIYWPAAGHILSRKLVLTNFRVDFDKEVPLNSWVGVWSYKDAEGRVIGYTQGLPLFGGTDFEVVDAPESEDEVRGRLYGLINYAMCQGWVIQNGDTIGVDEHEKIALNKQPAELGRSGWVFRLSYRQASPENPWK